MKEYKRIMVCVDNFERDEKLLEYLSNFVQLAQTEQVDLLYVSEELWRPIYVADTMAEMRLEVGIPPVPDIALDERQERLQNLAERTLGCVGGCIVKTHVVYGAPLYEILDFSLRKNADLIAMRQSFGEASEKGSKALLAKRITRRSTCSILIVPEHATFDRANILIPIRNSDCSQNALIEAARIAKSTQGMLEALNIYQVHSDYLLSGVSLVTHLNKLEKHATLETQTLLDRTTLPNIEIRTHSMPDFNSDPVKIIHRRARENEANMVVIGAKGRTGAAGVLLGTVTEQLIQSSEISVLAVKKKGECIGVLKAMLSVMGFKN
jgi:nucleotide-binding universal stress UspA family protein